jgi:Trypsin-like peptidase domain
MSTVRLERARLSLVAPLSLALWSSVLCASSALHDEVDHRVVRVLTRSHGGRETKCLGYMIATEWVVTARHCTAETVSAVVLVDFGMTLPVISIDEHPTADAALLRVSGGVSLSMAKIGSVCKGGYTMFSPGGAAWPLVNSSRGATLAGPASVYESSSSWVRVQSAPTLMPCRGDSGGPLVNSNGELVGILTRGSQACRGRDEYYIPESAWISAMIDRSCSIGSESSQ